jgi:hypothetical protein
MSEDLFGNEIEDAPQPTKKPTAVPDMEIVKTVLERARSERPYMLIGPTGHVHRLGENNLVKPCIFWEAAAVHHLIGQKLLTVGGYHTYETRHGSKSGQSIFVPKATRDMLNRWRALKPLHSNGNSTRRSA